MTQHSQVAPTGHCKYLYLSRHVVPLSAAAVIRKDLILVDGQVGNCKTDVAVGQQLQQLEPVKTSKGPRAVSLQVRGAAAGMLGNSGHRLAASMLLC